jgi:hypothetical protein
MSARIQESGKQERRNERVQGNCVKKLRSAEKQEQKYGRLQGSKSVKTQACRNATEQGKRERREAIVKELKSAGKQE